MSWLFGNKPAAPTPAPAQDPHDAIIPADLFTKLDKFKEILTNFNQNDPNFVSKYIEEYNKSVPENLQLNTTKLGSQLKRIDQFHSLLVKKISTDPNATAESLKTSTMLQDQFKTSMNDTSKLVETTLPQIAREQISKETEQLLKDPLIQKDPNVNKTVTGILDQIVSMKSRYSFFEYKYVQMNVLLLVIVKNMYSTMVEAINNIIDLHKKQNELRNKEVREIFDIMLSILKSAELQITPQDFDKLSTLIDNVKLNAEQDHKKLQEKAEGHINVLNPSNIMTNTPGATTGQPQPIQPGATTGQPQPQPQSRVGGFVRDKTRTMRTSQDGGFVRFNSTFPAQEFQNIGSEGGQ
jgi:hypothetical protein